MSEPSTNVPGEVADAQVDESVDAPQPAEEKVELDLDEGKLEAWDEVKSDYQVDPDGSDIPAGAEADADADAGEKP